MMMPGDAERLDALYGPYLRAAREARMMPYLMSKTPIQLDTPIIQTDEYGFRRCVKDGRRVSLDEFRAAGGATGIVVGGSVVFGAAASSDLGALSNCLNRISPSLYWNGGVGACNGFVELLVYLLVGRPVDHVISLSGANDLLLHLGSAVPYSHLFPFEGEAGFSTWAGDAGRADSAEFDGFAEIVGSLGPEPAPQELETLRRLTMVRAGYDRCIAAIERQVRTWKAAHHGRYLYVLNPHLACAKTPNREEDSFYRIALSRMPPYSRCQRLLIRLMYPDFRDDVARIMKNNQVPYLDASAVDYPESTCFIDDFHLTDTGFESLARAIASALEEAAGR